MKNMTLNQNFIYIALSEILIGVLIFLVFVFLKRTKILETRFSFRLLCLVEVVFGVVIFIIGLVGGYNLCKISFPSKLPIVDRVSGASDNSNVEKDSVEDKIMVDFNYEGKSVYLYAKPDDISEVIYELKENTSLEIIDRAAGWYRVLLSDNTNGWVKIEEIPGSLKL